MQEVASCMRQTKEERATWTRKIKGERKTWTRKTKKGRMTWMRQTKKGRMTWMRQTKRYKTAVHEDIWRLDLTWTLKSCLISNKSMILEPEEIKNENIWSVLEFKNPYGDHGWFGRHVWRGVPTYLKKCPNMFEEVSQHVWRSVPEVRTIFLG